MKQTLIIKNSKTKLDIHKEYMEVSSEEGENIVAYRYVEKLYINKHIDVKPYELIYLAHLMQVSFIDRFGNILAKVQLV